MYYCECKRKVKTGEAWEGGEQKCMLDDWGNRLGWPWTSSMKIMLTALPPNGTTGSWKSCLVAFHNSPWNAGGICRGLTKNIIWHVAVPGRTLFRCVFRLGIVWYTVSNKNQTAWTSRPKLTSRLNLTSRPKLTTSCPKLMLWLLVYPYGHNQVCYSGIANG